MIDQEKIHEIHVMSIKSGLAGEITVKDIDRIGEVFFGCVWLCVL